MGLRLMCAHAGYLSDLEGSRVCETRKELPGSRRETNSTTARDRAVCSIRVNGILVVNCDSANRVVYSADI